MVNGHFNLDSVVTKHDQHLMVWVKKKKNGHSVDVHIDVIDIDMIVLR